MEKNPADAACLGLLCRPGDLSCSELTSQIRAIVQVAGQVSEDFRFESGCQLEADVLRALDILNQRLVNDSATSADVKAQLATLSNLPCIPVQLEVDASRTSSNSVEFVHPCRCFFRLPGTMRADSGHYFWQVEMENLATLKALGVRDEPTIQDWANIAASLAESCGDNPLPPNEQKVAIAAVNRIANILDEDGDTAESPLENIFVLSSHKRLVRARKCVWVDTMALKGRCDGLEELGFHFPAKAFVDSTSADLEVLCRHGVLKRASGLVKEQVPVTCTDSEPSHQQDEFGLLFKSSEFRTGLRALVVPEMAQPDEDTGPDALDNLMDRPKLRWMEELQAELVMVESGQPVAGSERGQPALYQQEQGAMVLCNTLLDLDKLATSWLADQICVMLNLAGIAGKIGQKELVLDVLKCDGTGGIVKVLKEANIVEIMNEEHDIAKPGMPVELEYYDFLRTALNYTSFHVEEVVAVSSRGDGNEEVLLYAKVVELEHGEAAESYLERQYRLQIGPDAGSTALFKFIHIYKISCSAIPAPPPRVSEPSSALVEGGDGSQFAGSSAATADAKRSLIKQLKEMEKLSSLENYKSAFRRLCLQYHPDQSQQSSELFHLVKNHQVCFVRWMEEGIRFTDADCISGSPAQSTWFAQARRDRDAARLLSQGSFYSHAVWMSQQAGEKLIKATMLRTCGLTMEEMKGESAHNLVKLASLFHKSTLPAPILQSGGLETLYIH